MEPSACFPPSWGKCRAGNSSAERLRFPGPTTLLRAGFPGSTLGCRKPVLWLFCSDCTTLAQEAREDSCCFGQPGTHPPFLVKAPQLPCGEFPLCAQPGEWAVSPDVAVLPGQGIGPWPWLGHQPSREDRHSFLVLMARCEGSHRVSPTLQYALVMSSPEPARSPPQSGNEALFCSRQTVHFCCSNLTD